MISYDEVKNLSLGMLKDLCLNRRINLMNYSLGAVGGETMNQVLEYLVEENFILHNSSRKMIEITDKGRIEFIKRL